VRTVQEALELASRPLARADAEQYYHDKFDTYFAKLQPPIDSSQQEAIIDFLNSRVRDLLLPELAEWELRDRLDPVVRSELSAKSTSGHMEAARHISQFILTKEQRDALARFGLWKQAAKELN
jgi:hypothetical protein